MYVLALAEYLRALSAPKAKKTNEGGGPAPGPLPAITGALVSSLGRRFVIANTHRDPGAARLCPRSRRGWNAVSRVYFVADSSSPLLKAAPGIARSTTELSLEPST